VGEEGGLTPTDAHYRLQVQLFCDTPSEQYDACHKAIISSLCPVKMCEQYPEYIRMENDTIIPVFRDAKRSRDSGTADNRTSNKHSRRGESEEREKQKESEEKDRERERERERSENSRPIIPSPSPTAADVVAADLLSQRAAQKMALREGAGPMALKMHTLVFSLELKSMPSLDLWDFFVKHHPTEMKAVLSRFKSIRDPNQFFSHFKDLFLSVGGILRALPRPTDSVRPSHTQQISATEGTTHPLVNNSRELPQLKTGNRGGRAEKVRALGSGSALSARAGTGTGMRDPTSCYLRLLPGTVTSTLIVPPSSSPAASSLLPPPQSMLGRTNNFDYSYGQTTTDFSDSEGSPLVFTEMWDSVTCHVKHFGPEWSQPSQLKAAPTAAATQTATMSVLGNEYEADNVGSRSLHLTDGRRADQNIGITANEKPARKRTRWSSREEDPLTGRESESWVAALVSTAREGGGGDGAAARRMGDGPVPVAVGVTAPTESRDLDLDRDLIMMSALRKRRSNRDICREDGEIEAGEGEDGNDRHRMDRASDIQRDGDDLMDTSEDEDEKATSMAKRKMRIRDRASVRAISAKATSAVKGRVRGEGERSMTASNLPGRRACVLQKTGSESSSSLSVNGRGVGTAESRSRLSAAEVESQCIRDIQHLVRSVKRAQQARGAGVSIDSLPQHVSATEVEGEVEGGVEVEAGPAAHPWDRKRGLGGETAGDSDADADATNKCTEINSSSSATSSSSSGNGAGGITGVEVDTHVALCPAQSSTLIIATCDVTPHTASEDDGGENGDGGGEEMKDVTLHTAIEGEGEGEGEGDGNDGGDGREDVTPHTDGEGNNDDGESEGEGEGREGDGDTEHVATLRSEVSEEDGLGRLRERERELKVHLTSVPSLPASPLPSVSAANF
jgi:hypothetical protein